MSRIPSSSVQDPLYGDFNIVVCLFACWLALPRWSMQLRSRGGRADWNMHFDFLIGRSNNAFANQRFVYSLPTSLYFKPTYAL